MNSSLDACLSSNKRVKGFICADTNGLCITAKGDLEANQAGRFVSIVRHAGLVAPDAAPAMVLIETASDNILVKEYDSMTSAYSMTVAVKCSRTED
mmetsp:Transcript_37032/g.37690  ORF Transcript_37032/g.37690 Transcript_37032/m.37690 type:complete len:96 (-) Transcript_37032:210-497(-)